MAHKGQVIESPVSGERIVFRRTASETQGSLLEFDPLRRRYPGWSQPEQRDVKQVLAMPTWALLLLAAWAGVNPALAVAALGSVCDIVLRGWPFNSGLGKG